MKDEGRQIKIEATSKTTTSDDYVNTTTSTTSTTNNNNNETVLEGGEEGGVGDDKDQEMDETESFRDLSRQQPSTTTTNIEEANRSNHVKTTNSSESSEQTQSSDQNEKEEDIKKETKREEETKNENGTDEDNLENMKERNEDNYSMFSKKMKLNETVLSDVNSNRKEMVVGVSGQEANATAATNTNKNGSDNSLTNDLVKS